MRHHTTFAIGALLAAAGVGLGAFGAHGLEAMVEPDMLANWETGVRYHMYAALALLALGLRPEQRRAPWFLLSGAAVFSGSLYLMVLTGARWLGAITPIGGVLIIVGLVLAAFDVRRARRPVTEAPERESAHV
ncbi:MAG: DUF423 domain-containing protein [Propionibacteriaceae bacterium]|nr:DUF423 domain-containing protein [Propionibacteriaceae bacterium]